MTRPTPFSSPTPELRKEDIEDLLKEEHKSREDDMINVLKHLKKPEDYLRRVDREDKRYNEVMNAIHKYFLPVEEWKKEVGVE